MIRIITNRKEIKNISWQIVHEWEDDFISHLNIHFLYKREFYKNIIDKIRYNKKVVRLFPPVLKGDCKIIFQMTPPYEFNYFSCANCISIIIDVWKSDLTRVKEFCTYNKWIFVGSLEAQLQLKSMGVERVSYLPVSISKKYKHKNVPYKDVDLIVYGRNHIVMNSWITHLKSDTTLNIVECKPDDSGQLGAWSSLTGYLGLVSDRASLMQLIARSRYVAVSSPGNDNLNDTDKLRTGGFSPVTPRFLEAAVNYSIGIGIFPSNPDYAYCKIDEAAVAVHTYEAFKNLVTEQPDYAYWKPRMDAFLDLHWTDKRIEEVKKKMYA